MLNFREHVLDDFAEENLDQYFVSGVKLNDMAWRTAQPYNLFSKVESQVFKRLSI